MSGDLKSPESGWLDGPDEETPATTGDPAEVDLDWLIGGTEEGPASPRRRRWRSRRARAAETADESGEDGEFAPVVAPELVGVKSRPSLRAARRGRYTRDAAALPTTSRQGEVLNPALIAPPLDDEGVVVGFDMLSKSVVAHDPFTAYGKQLVASPGVLVLGAIGGGKSALLKTVYGLRPLILRNRRVVNYDRKDQGGEGEYSELCRRVGGAIMSFRISGGPGVASDSTRLNLLDPLILDVLGADGVHRLIQAIAERARGTDAPLDEWEIEALRRAVPRALADAERGERVAVLEDLTRALGSIDGVPAWEDYSTAARERVHQAGLTVRQLLNGVVAGELTGLFDGETSSHFALNNRLTSFDISQLPARDDSPATAMVLGVANALMMGSLRRNRGWKTNVIYEEGWDMVSGPIARQINANTVLARGLGISNITALHQLAQIPLDSEARALIRNPQTVHIYRQDRTVDAEACVDMFDLDPGAVSMLMSMPNGQHLLKIGARAPIKVQHVRSPLEVELTDTDSAMRGALAGLELS